MSLPDTGRDLCSQPTLSRLENAPRLRDVTRLTYKVLSFQSTMIEMYPKIKSKPFRGSHRAQFVIRPPSPRPARNAQLMVSYRFTVRTPCLVAVEPLGGEALLVTVEFRESAARREYQPRLCRHVTRRRIQLMS
jgi:hypothetical protein